MEKKDDVEITDLCKSAEHIKCKHCGYIGEFNVRVHAYKQKEGTVHIAHYYCPVCNEIFA